MTYRISSLLCITLLFLAACPDEEFPIGDPIDTVMVDTAGSDTALPELPDYNVAPAVLVTSPSPGTMIAAGDSVKLVGQVSDDRDSASDLVCTWISNLDGPLGQTVPLDAGLAQLVVEGLSVGQHSLTLEAVDSEGLRGSAQGVLLVNGPPTAPTVAIEPASPSVNDDLVALIVEAPVDPNRSESELIFEWRWSRDGALVPDLVEAIVPADRTLAGETWSVRVRAFDGYIFSAEVDAEILIGDAEGDAP